MSHVPRAMIAPAMPNFAILSGRLSLKPPKFVALAVNPVGIGPVSATSTIAHPGTAGPASFQAVRQLASRSCNHQFSHATSSQHLHNVHDSLNLFSTALSVDLRPSGCLRAPLGVFEWCSSRPFPLVCHSRPSLSRPRLVSHSRSRFLGNLGRFACADLLPFCTCREFSLRVIHD